jgi:hypothetical protein
VRGGENMKPVEFYEKYAIYEPEAQAIPLNIDDGELPKVDIRTLGLTPDTFYRITEGRQSGQRSENDMVVMTRLVAAGIDDKVIKAIFFSNPIGAKCKERRGYFEHSLRKAKAYVSRSEF